MLESINRPLAKVDFRPLAPQFWGNLNSKSPRIGGFRGLSKIYARGLMSIHFLIAVSGNGERSHQLLYATKTNLIAFTKGLLLF